MQFLVNKTYETWDEESVEIGDTDNRGFEYQDNVMTLRELIREMQNNGITEPSCSSIQAGIWFSSIDDEIDYRTGERTQYTLHFKHIDGKTVSGRNMKRIVKLLKT